MSVADEVNKSVKGGEPLDPIAIDEAEKKKRLAAREIENAANAARLAGTDSKTVGEMSAESTATVSDKFVPPKTSQEVSGGLGSTAVPQQWDTSVPQDGIDKSKEPQEKFVPKKKSDEKSGSIGPSSEVPQQTSTGKDGI
jgi:hypothetical protein